MFEMAANSQELKSPLLGGAHIARILLSRRTARSFSICDMRSKGFAELEFSSDALCAFGIASSMRP